MVIINRIGEVAKERGMSVQQVSDKADIAYNTALNLFRGVVTRIDLEVLDKVCEALGAEPGDLLVRVPNKTQA